MKRLLIILFICSISIVSCTKNNSSESSALLVSNLSDESSINEVKDILKNKIKEENINNFLNYVREYNTTIENTSLVTGFKRFNKNNTYNILEISSLWAQKQGDFVGTNCRINSFLLLKNSIIFDKIDKLNKLDKQDSILFLDYEAMENRNIFSSEDVKKFDRIFEKVKTVQTKDVDVHYNIMKKHFEDIKFDENAKFLFVVLHDDLDGDYLFIGHVGVLVEYADGYIFIEKISFEEPYQIFKSKDKNEIYKYLLDKYKDYATENTAKPFIMENSELVNIK